MAPDARAAEALERRRAADVGAMGVSEDDVRQFLWRAPDALQVVDDLLGVGVEQRVDQRQPVVVLEEVGALVGALLVGLHALRQADDVH